MIEERQLKEYKVIINPLSIVKSVSEQNEGTEIQPGISPGKFTKVATIAQQTAKILSKEIKHIRSG